MVVDHPRRCPTCNRAARRLYDTPVGPRCRPCARALAGQALAERRTALGLSIAAFARVLSAATGRRYDATRIHDWEHGKYLPGAEAFRKRGKEDA